MQRTSTPYSCRKTGNRVCIAASPGSQKPNSTDQNTLTGNSKIMPPMPASMRTPARTQRAGATASSLPARRSKLSGAGSCSGRTAAQSVARTASTRKSSARKTRMASPG